MRSIRSLASLFALALLSAVALAQTESSSPTPWWLRLRSTGYAYQTVDAQGGELDHFGFYQHYDTAVAGLLDGKLSVRASGRFADDLMLKERVTDQERLYVAYAQLDMTRLGQARFGRQFLQEGPTGELIDGLWLNLTLLRRLHVHTWAGAASPLSRIYEFGDIGEDGVVGVRIKSQLDRRLQLAASFASEERSGQTHAQRVGGEATLLPARWLRVRADAFYEAELETWERVAGLAQLNFGTLPMLSLQFLDRRPQIAADSYFSRFSEAERIRVARATLSKRCQSGWGGELDYFNSFVDTRSSARIGASLLYRFLRVGYSARLGDAGEESRWFGDIAYEINSWLAVEGGAAVATYALVENAPSSAERDLVTAFGRARVDLRPGLRFLTEIQSLDNPNYSEDIRVLIGLDLSVGRGPSRFGLNGGGWFQ